MIQYGPLKLLKVILVVLEFQVGIEVMPNSYAVVF